jgi:hypothetical protein
MSAQRTVRERIGGPVVDAVQPPLQIVTANDAVGCTLDARATSTAGPQGMLVRGREWPTVPDGRYTARFVGYDVVQLTEFKGEARVFAHFKIVDPGPYCGVMLYRAFRVPTLYSRRRFAVTRRGDLLRTHCLITDCDRRPRTINLSEWKPFLVMIETRTVVTDARSRRHPRAFRYSVVADVVEVVAGER